MKIILMFKVFLVVAFINAMKGMVFRHEQRTWTMEPVGVEWEITDEELVKVDMKVQRINRTSFAFDGTIELFYEFDESTMIESTMYRSATGSKDSYQQLPYQLPRIKIYDCLDQYKDEISKNLKNCSNFPVIETQSRDYEFRKLHRLDKCTYSTEVMPTYLPEGYYKVIVQFSGETSWSLTFLVRIESIKK